MLLFVSSHVPVFLFDNFSLMAVFREGLEGRFFISEALQLDAERYVGSQTDCVDRG
jgi:hypothetical protein